MQNVCSHHKAQDLQNPLETETAQKHNETRGNAHIVDMGSMDIISLKFIANNNNWTDRYLPTE